MALHHDEDEQYVLSPKLALRATPTLLETKQVQPAMSAKEFLHKKLEINPMPNYQISRSVLYTHNTPILH